MKSIVVGFDEGEESDDALALGRALAEAEDATLKVAVALDYAPVPIEDTGVSTVSIPETEAVMKDGDPAEVLAAQADELDFLVLGSRGYGPIRRALLGGVSAEVMRTAPCPVIVVPRGSVAAEPDS
jgi:nucleotide-binding universal stress UspA family protein